MHLVLIFIMNSVPSFILLFTSTDPPIYSIIFLQIDNPNPVPYLFLAEFSSNLLKSMKSFYLPSSEIPTPVSIMLI
jgi:hypothetical protein